MLLESPSDEPANDKEVEETIKTPKKSPRANGHTPRSPRVNGQTPRSPRVKSPRTPNGQQQQPSSSFDILDDVSTIFLERATFAKTNVETGFNVEVHD